MSRPATGSSFAAAGRRAGIALALIALASACSGGGGDDRGASEDTGPDGSAGSQVATEEDATPADGATTTVVVVPDTYTGVTPEVAVTVAPVQGGALEEASEKQQDRAQQVADAVGSAGSLTKVWVLADGNDPLATVSRYQVDAASAASARFRDQFAVQMLTAAQAVAPPRFVDVDGTTVAVSEGPTSAAAWFRDDEAVLLVANDDEAGAQIESLVRTAVSLVADA